nr:TRAP transporter large permease subunit [Pseudovibrio ascidiaceicola]
MNVSGIADRIFTFTKTLVVHIHGGLPHVNNLASIVFSGMSGVARFPRRSHMGRRVCLNKRVFRPKITTTRVNNGQHTRTTSAAA